MTSYENLGTKVRHLIELLDGDVTGCYLSAGLTNYKPRYTPVFKSLINNNSMTIGAIAENVAVSQPAISKTVREMIKQDLVEKVVGQDGRENKIKLTKQGLAIVPKLQAQWRATTLAAKTLDEELSSNLFATLDKTIKALEKQSFGERILRAQSCLKN